MLHRVFFLLASFLMISAAEPPPDVPVPQPKPDQQTVPGETQKPSETQKPTPKPAPPQSEKSSEPVHGEDEKKSSEPSKPVEETAKPEEEQPEPVKEEDPAALQACLGALKEIGAGFKTLAPIRDEDAGCGIASPIELSEILPGIKLEPAGTMRCQAALALSRWTKDMMLPAANLAFPDRKVTAIANASTYVCRNRNSAENGKISEHAKGNAVDISTIAFDKGEPLVMKPRTEDGTPEGAFQRTITAAACLFFRTVLSPGSDATHQDHLHLDVLERKGDFLYCR